MTWFSSTTCDARTVANRAIRTLPQARAFCGGAPGPPAPLAARTCLLKCFDTAATSCSRVGLGPISLCAGQRGGILAMRVHMQACGGYDGWVGWCAYQFVVLAVLSQGARVQLVEVDELRRRAGRRGGQACDSARCLPAKAPAQRCQSQRAAQWAARLTVALPGFAGGGRLADGNCTAAASANQEDGSSDERVDGSQRNRAGTTEGGNACARKSAPPYLGRLVSGVPWARARAAPAAA